MQLIYKSVYCLVCHFAVCCSRPRRSPSSPFLFFLLLHPTPQKLQPSARERISHGTLQSSIPVLCCVIVFLSSSLAVTILVWSFGCLVLVLLVVLCLCRQVFCHWFWFLAIFWTHPVNNLLTSFLHTSSTHHGPLLWNLTSSSSSHSSQSLWWLLFFTPP